MVLVTLVEQREKVERIGEDGRAHGRFGLPWR